MNIPNADLFAALDALKTLAQRKLAPKTALKAVRSLRAVEQAAREVETVRGQIIERHTEKDEAGKPVPVLGEDGKPLAGRIKLTDPESFTAELGELMEATSEVRAEAFTLEELGEDAIEPGVLLGLGVLLQEDAPTLVKDEAA